MSDRFFYRLASFIQEYIYRNNWEKLRGVQVDACKVLFDMETHLLIASGTASGKTEAAFLPILTLLDQDPSSTIGVLYIGPLKALINDQFMRIKDLLKEANIPVWHWHGDVGQSQKSKMLKNPKGVLQITPESLESLLINKNADLSKIFGDLRFIVIDEIHAFMGSDRGNQIICQLERLARYMRNEPRRVGLSATLGDFTLAEKWLQSGTSKYVETVTTSGGDRIIRLSVEHFFVSDTKQGEKPLKDNINQPDDYGQYIFEKSKMKKTLIFANNRSQTEEIIADLRRLAKREGLTDIYHVHHGSISSPLREAAEEAMRHEFLPAVTAATITLELGIDIGQLERVIQIGSPNSVSSFLQRLGRSGRRGNPAEMWFVTSEQLPHPQDFLPDQIPWDLLQCIAIIQLYVEEHWIEPIQSSRYPFSLLYHQTMSTLASTGELSPRALAQRILTLTPFQTITQEEFREFLLYLIKIDHLEQTEERGLIIGLTGEKIVRNFRFYAVFPDNDEFKVRDESREIGSIVQPPPSGERFALAGLTWEVLDVDLSKKVVYVKQVKGKAKITWNGNGAGIHTKVLERMRRVLYENVEYPYLQDKGLKRLRDLRQTIKNSGLNTSNILSLGGNTYCIFPWMGTTSFRTLDKCLMVRCSEKLGIRSMSSLSPYFLKFEMMRGTIDDLKREIRMFCEDDFNEESIIAIDEGPILQKYDEFVSTPLRRKAFALDYLNLQEMREIIKLWDL